MLQSKQRLLELNAKLAETLTSKGVTATADETTTALVNKVTDIDDLLKILIERDTMIDFNLPYGIKTIGKNAFYYNQCISSLKIPETVEIINDYAFVGCSKINGTLLIPKSVKKISSNAFDMCSGVDELILSDGVEYLGYCCFRLCLKFKKITIPSSLMNIGDYAFHRCENIEIVKISEGFNCDNLNLSASTLYTRETILQWLNALADRTGQTAYKLTIGAKNLAKLTEEDILIATNKNWTLA